MSLVTEHELDAELNKMKEADKGLLQKASDMIDGTIETIKQLGDLLMNTLMKAAGAVDACASDGGFCGTGLLELVEVG